MFFEKVLDKLKGRVALADGGEVIAKRGLVDGPGGYSGRKKTPVTEEQEEIAKKIYKKKFNDLSVDQRSRIRRGEITLESKSPSLGVSPKERGKASLTRAKTFITKFKKENKGKLPSISTIMKEANVDYRIIKKALDEGKIKVANPSEYKGAYLKKQVSDDLVKMYKNNKIMDAIKNGKIPDKKLVAKIIGSDEFKASERIIDLADALSGTYEVEGITPKYKKGALAVIEQSDKIRRKKRLSAERKVGASVGEKPTRYTAQDITKQYPDSGITSKYNIDEPGGVVSSARRGTEPYGNFIQIIDKDINTTEKATFDNIKSVKERILQGAIKSKDPKKITQAINSYNQSVDKYEKILNKGIKPGEKKIKLFRASLNSPEKTIANFSKLPKNYQQAFLDNYTKQGYSFKVPSDIKTAAQVKAELSNPKNKAKLLQRYKRGNVRLYTQGIGPTFIAELPLYTMAQGKPFIETIEPITFGAFNPVTYAAKKQAGLSDAEKIAMQREKNLNLLRTGIANTSRQEMLGMKDPEYRALGPGKPSYLDFLIQKMEQPDYVGSLTSGQQKIEDKAQELRQKVMTPEKVKEAKTRYESFQKALPIAPLVTNIIESAVAEEKFDPYQKTLDFLGGPKYQPDQVYKKGGIVALDEYKELRKKYGP